MYSPKNSISLMLPFLVHARGHFRSASEHLEYSSNLENLLREGLKG